MKLFDAGECFGKEFEILILIEYAQVKRAGIDNSTA